MKAPRNVVITGSSRGIGWALARAFAKRGDTLFLVQRTWDDSKMKELASLGAAHTHKLTCDLTKNDAVIELGK